LSCVDDSSKRSFNKAEYHFIFRMTWMIPSRFAVVSVIGFENT